MNGVKKYSELIPDSRYDKLVLSGVICSCGHQLDKDEIVRHKFVGITEKEDMLCSGCWAEAAYINK